ncbi:MAG: SAM-dependent methyltransferase, partial [Actinomycetota bacterium]
GIMAFQALAAEGGVVLTDEQQTIVLLPASIDPGTIEAELGRPERTVILYKGGARVGAIADQLEATGRLDDAVLGELVGMPGEQITDVASMRERPASYLSTIIAPAPEGAGPTPPAEDHA